MSQKAKFTISGLRGVWGEGLNEDIVKSYIKSYAVFLQKRGARKVIIGMDSRTSGPIIKNIATSILSKAGLEVIDIGIAPTPTVIFLIRDNKLDGGIMISASHNPPEYNGLKFFNSEALYLNEEQLEKVKSYIGKSPILKEAPALKIDYDLGEKHVEKVLENVDINIIRKKKFKVVIDTINGAGYKLGPMLLEKLGCEVEVLNGNPDGNFAHMPEPLEENLTGLCQKVKDVHADIGFALDPDADRLVLCNEEGKFVFEEYMLSLCIKSVLYKTPGDIVVNLSTSNTNQDLVEAVGCNIYRTKVGEGNVVEGILKHNAIIGGEGSGGVIYPKMNLCRDSIVGMALILEYQARRDEKISQLVSELPKYEFVKTKMPFEGNAQEIVSKVIEEFEDGKADTQDGVRIDFSDSSWVQLRASNTEPIIRIWSEAKTKDRANELIEKVKNLI